MGVKKIHLLRKETAEVYKILILLQRKFLLLKMSQRIILELFQRNPEVVLVGLLGIKRVGAAVPVEEQVKRLSRQKMGRSSW